MLRDGKGTSMIEYIIVIVIVIALVGVAVLAATSAVMARLNGVNVNIGS